MPARAADQLLLDLMPVPGRLAAALALTGLVLLTVVLAMSMQMPESALSCYLLFFAWRDNAGEAIFTAIKLIAAATLGILLAIPLLGAVVDDPMLRLAGLAGMTFLGMFLSQASRLGPLAATAGFVFAFILTLYDQIPSPALLSYAMQWIWVVLALPMLLLALWSALAGPGPLERLEAHLRALGAALEAPRGPAARALLDRGMQPMDDWLKFARLTGAARGPAASALARRADQAWFDLARAEAGLPPRPTSGATLPEKDSLFRPDAFTALRHLRFALKVLIAVLVTYGVYTAFGLFAIHTAMITCYYVALGTSGQTGHRIVLRLGGCLLGAAAGALTMALLMPYATDIGHLLLILAPATFAAAWIGLGPERIAYAGWQMALCFFLVVLQGFGPPGDIATATSRVIGIVFGSAVVWLVFATLWPENAADDATAALDELDLRLEGSVEPGSGRALAQLRAPLAAARQYIADAAFERSAPPRARFDQAESHYLTRVRRISSAAP